MHKNGMDHKLTRELSECERMAELNANIERGNHKGASTKPEKLLEKIHREVKHGYAIPVLVSILQFIPHIMV